MLNKKSLIATVLVSLLFTVLPVSAMNITGTYLCTGNDPTVSPAAFTQKMIITKQGDAYPIIEADGGTIVHYKQFGILTGDTLSVAYQATDSKEFGVQVFKIGHHGKKLSGPYMYWDRFDRKGSETCEKISDKISLK